jgi:hypothetical protein
MQDEQQSDVLDGCIDHINGIKYHPQQDCV